MDEPRPNEPRGQAPRPLRTRRNVPMMLLILGLVVMGLVLFNVRTPDQVELTLAQLHDQIMNPPRDVSSPPPADGEPAGQIVGKVVIHGGESIKGEYLPEYKAFRTFTVPYVPKDAI